MPERDNVRTRKHWIASSKDFLEIPHRKPGDLLPVVREHGLKRRDVLQFRFFMANRWHTIQSVDHLRVHRMLDPERVITRLVAIFTSGHHWIPPTSSLVGAVVQPRSTFRGSERGFLRTHRAPTNRPDPNRRSS
jgi:hypothetical protein